MLIHCSMRPRPPVSTLFPYTTLFRSGQRLERGAREGWLERQRLVRGDQTVPAEDGQEPGHAAGRHRPAEILLTGPDPDRKSTRLNSSHRCISYAVFCLKKKNTKDQQQ